jgi:membrane protein implicated in regulation of membrane protease activity
MIFFLICSGIGLTFLMVSLFTGNDGDISSADVDVDSSGVFSLRTIMAFLASFGATGALTLYFGLSILASSLSGVAAGFVFAYISWQMMNFAIKQQANSVFVSSDMIGKTAIVHSAIPLNGIGEILIEINGQRKYISARDKDHNSIDTNAQVKILENLSGIVIVQSI